MDCIWVNLKNVGPPFFKFISVYIKMSFKQLDNHSQLLCGRDFATERLVLPICGLELITNKIKRNYLKQRDLAPFTVRFTKLLTNSFRSLFEIPEVRYKFGNFIT